MTPLISKVPPFTVNVPAEAFNAAAFVTLKVPPLISVLPVYVLAADSVKVPVPSLVSAPVVLAAAPLRDNTPVA